MSNAEFRIQIENPSHRGDDIMALEDWLRRTRLRGLRVRREARPTQPGQMGPELLDILMVVLSSGAAVELVKLVHAWLASRRRKVVINIETPQGSLRLRSDDQESLEEIAKRFRSLMEARSGP